jgi:hypothetical protein
MQQPMHHFTDLFDQLGLPSDAQAIAHFLALHAPLAADLRLHDATFWTPAQASFLKESLLQDADWSGVADQLSEALRQTA